MHPELEHFRKLAAAEKLHVVEELWDEIGQSCECFPSPDWHRAETVYVLGVLHSASDPKKWRR